MSEQQQPFILKFNGSGNPTMTEVFGVDDPEVIITTPQDGPPVAIDPAGTPLDFTVNVIKPYSLTMPPGAIRVG